MTLFRHFALAVLFACSLVPGISIADDTDDARAQALVILKKLEQKMNNDVWANHVSSWFKKSVTEGAFLANVTTIEQQLGGVGTARTLVQQLRSDGDPSTGYKGKVYSYVFTTNFPVGKVYERIVLIDENGKYLLSGFYFSPNPN